MSKRLALEILRAAKSGAEVAEELLRQFDGWGDGDLVRALFPDGSPCAELRALLSDEEIAALRASTPTSFFTPMPLVEAVWGALAEALAGGDKPLRVLEPSAGMGAWIAGAPESLRERLRWSAIEPEPMSFAVLRARHPKAAALRARLEEVKLPDGSYDLVVGNPPYGDVPVVDHDAPDWATRNLHGYFLYRGLRALRPGGLLVYVTSRYTLDSSRAEALHRWVSRQAALIALARLPNGALSGTDVIADVLVFQRRQHGAPQRHDEPVDISPFPWRGGVWLSRVVINALLYPNSIALVIGEPGVGRGMYSAEEFTLTLPPEELPGVPARVANYLRQRLPSGSLAELGQREQAVAEPASPALACRGPDTSFGPPPRPADKPIWDDLAALYYALKAVLAADASGAADAEEKRAALRQRFDEYRARWGALSAPRTRNLLRGHPAQQMLLALEGEDGQPAPILERPVVRSAVIPRPQDARDALPMCLDAIGRVDPAWIAERLGKSPAEVIAELRGAIFRDPAQGGAWVTAEEYLSGDVRLKLEQAQQAALLDPAYAENVDALRAAQPAPVPRTEISAVFGAPWVGEDVVNAFLASKVGADTLRATYLSASGKWVVELVERYKASRANAVLGTPSVDAHELVEHTLNGRAVVVTRRDEQGNYVRDDGATFRAQAQQEALKRAWDEWVWDNPERAALLEGRYNARFNRWRPRRYDGGHLTLPGLASGFTPRKSQLDAAWRILQSRAVCLGHRVGKGKTAAIVIGLAELLRLGLASRAMVVVPNHLVGQWEIAFRTLYPHLRVTSVGEGELGPKQRAAFFARVATHDIQVIVVAMSQFTLLPVSPQIEREHLAREIQRAEKVYADLRDAQSARSRSRSVKELEKHIARLRARLEKLSQVRRDDARGTTFEELGVDALVVDEAHLFKNLGFVTAKDRVAGLPNSHSQRAWDMFLKVRWLLQQPRGRVIFATGTPVANTMAEAWTLMRYLMLDTLERLGLDHFDAWANTYAQAIPSVELAPDGSGFRVVTRLAKWVNLPELAALMRQVLDIPPDNRDPLPGEPALYGSKPVAVVLPPSKLLRRYTGQLVERAEAVRSGKVSPSEDNMLKITSDGRKAALDMRLVAALPKPPVTKLGIAARIIADIYHASGPLRAAQMVFCDLGTPKARRDEDEDDERDEGLDPEAESLANRVYDELARLLVARGVKAEEIAFVHQAKDKQARQALFRRVDAGEIRVLIGSTEKMGTGVNAQRRLIALHHLDAPWRPDQVEQRNGRILRPGNELPEVFVFHYETSASFDAYVWQTLHTKAAFIDQITAAEVTARTADEVGEAVLTYAELKALATGDPRVQQRIMLETEANRLRRMRANWEDGRAKAQQELLTLPKRRAKLLDDIGLIERAQAAAAGLAAFALTTHDGRKLEKREEIGQYLRSRSADAAELAQGTVRKPAGQVGPFRLTVVTSLHRPEPAVEVEFEGERLTDEARVTDTAKGTAASLEYSLSEGLERQARFLRQELARVEGALAQAERAAAPWPDEEKLVEVERQLAALGDPTADKSGKPDLSAVVGAVLASRQAVRAALARVRSVVAALTKAAPEVAPAEAEAAPEVAPAEVVPVEAAPAEAVPAEAAPEVAPAEVEVAPTKVRWTQLTFGELAALKPRKRSKPVAVPEGQLSIFELL
jgi:N12 class adenine-specific DNA methylase